ncbi:MAG TPA: BON domain-containing protein [Pirellulaceae bacterium]|nr:BON domain-containing protein [Pirellulaceae bacterium]
MTRTISNTSHLEPARWADEDLTHRIRLFLQSLQLAVAKRIEVEVEQGVVTITGRVRSRYERQLALSCVRRVAGVRQVEDRMVVAENRPFARRESLLVDV